MKGRNLEGYYELSRLRVTLPTDWSSLEEAFEQKSAVVGIVTGVVKGGLNVDVGVRAFMPASRSGVREAAEMEKLVGQEITCRITKLDGRMRMSLSTAEPSSKSSTFRSPGSILCA